MAFGTLIAASLPLLMGLATITVSLGGAFLLAEIVPVSNLLGNVVSMVGLAIGIDYSLLMVTHYREHVPQDSAAQTVAGTVAEAGQTICWSGVTVMVGFLGLLFSPILETRCAGIGGALVVCVSVLAALTLLPACVVVLSPWLERWPVVPHRWRLGNTTHLWTRLGLQIVRHPLVTLAVSRGVRARRGVTRAPCQHGRLQRTMVPAARHRVPDRRRHREHDSQRQCLHTDLRRRQEHRRRTGARRIALETLGGLREETAERRAHRGGRLARHLGPEARAGRLLAAVREHRRGADRTPRDCRTLPES